MVKIKIIAFLFFLFCFQYSIAQIDAIKIESAEKAYNNNEYQLSLDLLNEVSNNNRNNKVYAYYKGFSFYKISQYDSAEIYLKKYLIFDVNNEEVTNALTDIDYEKKKIKKAEDDRETERKEAAENERKRKAAEILAQQQQENYDYQNAKNTGSIAAMKSYLSLHPNGLHAIEAEDFVRIGQNENASLLLKKNEYQNQANLNKANWDLYKLEYKSRKKAVFRVTPVLLGVGIFFYAFAYPSAHPIGNQIIGASFVGLAVIRLPFCINKLSKAKAKTKKALDSYKQNQAAADAIRFKE